MANEEVERSDDGRYIIVSGRRWRASDPGIPENLRQELVDELMAARRLVRTDPASARPRVHDAKVALGERGQAWWEPPTEASLRARATATIRALLTKRDGSTICPSDVARVVGGESWRERMESVRAVAWELVEQSIVVITQGGSPVSRGATGPIRIGRGAKFEGRNPQSGPDPKV